MEFVKSPEFFKNEKNDEIQFPYFYGTNFSIFSFATEGKAVWIAVDLEGNSLAFRRWQNKFISIVQPLYPPLSPEGRRLSNSLESNFTEGFIEELGKQNFSHRICQAENFAIFSSAPNKAKYAPFGTYYLDLEAADESELFSKLHPKHRNVIRNAEKSGVQLLYGPEVLGDFYELYQATTRRSGMFCWKFDYFEKLISALGDNILCGAAYFEGKACGALVMPFTKFAAFYLYGATPDEREVNGAMNFLHWKTIEMMKRNGVARYDFVGARLGNLEGTPYQGIQMFKMRFGASLESGVLWKLDLKPKICSLFDNMAKVKLKLKGMHPPKDIIDQLS